jgi:hypothetical protein
MSPIDFASGAREMDPNRLGLILRESGWRVVGQRDGAYVRLAPPGVEGRSVLVPLDREAPEFSELIRAAVDDVENFMPSATWVSDVSARLIAQPVDGFRFTKESAAPSGMIAWPSGEQLIESARRTLTAGAKASLEHMSHYSNRLGQFANRYLDAVLMGQTAPGSYVVTAFCPTTYIVPITAAPVEESLFGEPENGMPSRQVGLSVMRAVEATVEAAGHYRETGSLAAFSELVTSGVSYEMASALRLLVLDSDGAEVSVAWDPAIPPPKSAPSANVELQAADAEILRRGAAQLLSDAAAPTHLVITGRVHLLSRKEAGGPGVIGVENLSTAKPRKVRVHLGDEDYHRALAAHDEDRAITVEGQVEREGNIHWMYAGRLVEVLATIDEIRDNISKSTAGQLPGQLSFGEGADDIPFG